MRGKIRSDQLYTKPSASFVIRKNVIAHKWKDVDNVDDHLVSYASDFA